MGLGRKSPVKILCCRVGGRVSKVELNGTSEEWTFSECTPPEFLVETPSEVVVVPAEVQQYLPTIHVAAEGVPRT